MSNIDSIPALVREYDVHHALTLCPEWAWAIAALDKRVENRSGRSPVVAAARKLIGKPLAIHAGAKLVDVDGMRITARWEGWSFSHARATVVPARGPTAPATVETTIISKGPRRIELDTRLEQAIACSAIVAVVRPIEVLEPGAKRAPWHARDEYGIRFELVAALPRPITAKGAQGVWRLDGR